MMNEMKKMKTLTLQGIPFEVVDEAARNDIESVKDTLENLPKNEIVTPDLAQNDPAAPDYVKNKPFYTAYVDDILYKSFGFSDWSSGTGGYYINQSFTGSAPSYYDSYFVKASDIYIKRDKSTLYSKKGIVNMTDYNGTVYETIVFGNASLLGIPAQSNIYVFDTSTISLEDTGEAHCFAIFKSADSSSLRVMIMDKTRWNQTDFYVGALQCVQLDDIYIPSTIQRVGGDVIILSSTEGSTKRFKITVDDNGTITATEVTQPNA